MGSEPHDANGNTIFNGGQQNVYDFENRLVQRGGVTIIYDGDGNRVQETVAGVTTKYLVGEINPTGYAQVLAELSGTNDLQRGYDWGLQLEAVREFTAANFNAVHYYGYDGHGSVRYLTSSTGAITDTYDYDAFGNLISSTGTTVNNYLFAGEQFDPALGIYYNRARYYDQRQGRFWTADTWEGDPQSPASLHQYMYTADDPTNRMDPSGRASVTELETTQAAGETVDAEEAEADQAAYQELTKSLLRNIRPAPLGALGKIAIYTLLGAILAGITVEVGGGTSSDSTILQAGQDPSNYGLFAFFDNSDTSKWKDGSGNVINGPRAPRVLGFTWNKGDIGQPDIDVIGGFVGPQTPKAGASTCQFVETCPVSQGVFWGIHLQDVISVEGLAVLKDGQDSRGGHHTIYPYRKMTAQDFINKFFQLPWVKAGQKFK